MSDMRSPRVFLSPPHMSGREQHYVNEAFASNYIAPAGPMLTAFENEFAAYVGIPHAVALASGTAAIHLALKSLELAPGDEVWASTLTFIGSLGAAIHDGLTPVFFDADRSTWTLDPELLRSELAVASKHGRLPKVVIPTDIYGQSSDLDAIVSACDVYGVPVISDSAEAVGTRYKGRHAGVGAFATAFSFNGNKIMTTSGGGLLASPDPRVIERARYLSTQARQPAAHYEHIEVGFNYRMSSICAAIGRGQLEAIEARVSRRREIFEIYRNDLSNIAGLRFMPEANYGRSSRWLTVIQVNPTEFGVGRQTIQDLLESNNIESRPVWKPMHMQPVFSQARCIGGSVAEALYDHGLCLPSGTQMSDEEVHMIAAHIRSASKNC